MIDYRTWLEHEVKKGKMPDCLPRKPLETNQQGGFDHENDKQKKVFKKVDLITLPEDVKGTNCGNCRFIKNKFFTHLEIQNWVNDRMCCAYWDNDGARRSWEIEDEGKK
jgi:hypothetical protein